MRDEYTDGPETESEADTDDVSSAIKSLIENAGPEATAPAPRPKQSPESDPARRAPKPAHDRWADLRAKFADLDDDEDEAEDEDDPAREPDEPAVDAAPAARIAAPVGTAEIEYFFDEAPAPAPAPAAAPEPEPEAQLAPRSDWDTPADHEMSRGARTAWRVGIYGTLVALPAAFFVLSPFSPKDTVQHHVSAMGCQFAALFDWENMKEGEPGFHAHLDDDADGIACEVKRQRIAGGGGGAFKSQ